MKEAVYLLCLARSDLLTEVQGVGVDGRNPIFIYSFMNIAAVVSMISLEEFCGPSAESEMQDLSWIGPRVCRHGEVVEQVMRRSPVLPVPFGTIFSSLDSLEDRLKKHRGAISESLAEVADKEEWAVKGLLNRAQAVEELLSAALSRQDKALRALPPGLRYFQEKRIRAEGETELNSGVRAFCRGVAEELRSFSSDFCQRKLPSRGGAGGDGQLVLNWAFLVPRGEVGAFQAKIDKINAEEAPPGLVLELSGPWPPYSFRPAFEDGSGT